MEGEVVKFPRSNQQPRVTTGTVGLATQVPGAAATVSNLSKASGGIKPGNIVERDTK